MRLVGSTTSDKVRWGDKMLFEPHGSREGQADASCPGISMSIECPTCGQRMTVRVGLTPDTSQNCVECVGCKKLMVALVPGPVVGGPFPEV